MNKLKAKTPDAAESNAGDDFHVLWAIRKTLELLNFNDDGLKAVAIEGLTNLDEKLIDADGDALLGVDLTEYYGSDNLKSATRVVISQLKYSTRHSDLPWTVSRICTGRKGKEDGSIIHKLAKFFKEATLKANPNLQIKLVSNRPAASELKVLIDIVQNAIKVDPGADLKKLKTGLTAQDKKYLDKLLKTSKLTGKKFIAFLAVLNFSDCGTHSRYFQKQLLIKALSELGTSESETELAKLRALVWGKMMPEGRPVNTIVQDDILISFGFANAEALFPVRPKFEVLKDRIDREQIRGVIKEILNSDQPVCLHAGAGIGKSTFVSLIPAFLPKQSICIKFDCYGGGAYLDPEDKRHKHKNAFMQLCNELALQIGTPFLLNTKLDEDDYVKEFKRRLELANEIINKINRKSVIAIVIDAADNAITAANLQQNKSFVNDIIDITYLDRTRLIFTTRTERISSINVNSEIKKISLQGFSIKESTRFLKNRYPSVTTNEIKEFRNLTKAIPRVMSYVLDISGDSLKEKVKLLKPNGKNLEEIFKLRIKTTEKKTGNKQSISDFLTYLICLPRPVPLSYIQKISGISESLIHDIGVDLWHGLVFYNNGFSFRDEDFEKYLRDNYKYNKTHINNICNYFLESAATDEYASVNLGVFLKTGNRKSELLHIVLDRKFLDSPVDPIKNKEVFIERARLAMQLCSAEASDLNFLKLQMIVAEAAKTNLALENVLVNNAELATSYGNLETNQRLYFQTGNPEWFGRVHFRSAAIYSRSNDTLELAKIHMDKAANWLNYRSRLDEEEARRYEITERDIAYGAEAVLRISGFKECVRWIGRWQPSHFIYDFFEVFINELIINSNVKQIDTWLDSCTLRTDLRLLVAKAAIKNGVSLQIDIDSTIASLNRFTKTGKKIGQDLYPALISFCEYAIIQGTTYSTVEPILKIINLSVPDRIPGFYGSYGGRDALENLDNLIRKAVIENHYLNSRLKIDDFYPARLNSDSEGNKNKSKTDLADEKTKFSLLYKHLLPIYELRFSSIINARTKKDRKKELEDILNRFKSDWDISHRFGYEFSAVRNFLCFKLLDIVFYFNAKEEIIRIKNTFTGQGKIELFLGIAKKISLSENYHTIVLDILQEVDKLVEDGNFPGSEQIDYYVQSALVASRISEATGKFYFDKVVACSNEIDLEAHAQIRCFNDIIGREKISRQAELAFNFSRYIEFCYDRLSGYDHFPWSEAIDTLTNLDISSMFAISSRWDHRNTRENVEQLNQILRAAISQSFIDHSTIYALLDLNYYRDGYYDLVAELIEKFIKGKVPEQTTRFLYHLINDIKIQYRSKEQLNLLKLVFDRISTVQTIEPRIVDDLRKYIEVLSKIVKPEAAQPKSKDSQDRNSEQIKLYTPYVRRLDFKDSGKIEECLKKLSKLTQNGYVNEDLVFGLIKERVTLKDRISYLDALINVRSDNTYFYYAFENAIDKLFAEWKSDPVVSKWKEGKLPIVLKTYFKYYISHDNANIGAMLRMAGLFDVERVQLCNYIIELLPEYINELSASVLYQFFYITTAKASCNDKLDLLNWTLPKWSSKIKPDYADGAFKEDIVGPENANITIARFIRYNLGHPNKKIRWRASHVLRNLAQFDKSEIFEQLLKEQNDHSCAQFQYQEYAFYWMSAKVQLWISLKRISKETPGFLEKYAKLFLNELKSRELPHAQVIWFIKATCLQLLKHNPAIYTAEEKELIRGALISQIVKKEKKATKSARKPDKFEASKTRFHFDSMDTLPYWFEPLGGVFNVWRDEVAKIADKYIIDIWGFTNEDAKERRVQSRDWSLTMHRHGSEPSIEELRTYLEYHAMHCAAIELLESRPVRKRNDWDEGLEDWLDRWTLCWEDYWLADFRDPLPLEKKYTNELRERENWEWGIEMNDFHKAIGLKDVQGTDFLVVQKYATVHYESDYETESVHSALVNINTASALLIALQTSKRYDYYLPYEKDSDRDFYDDDPGSNPDFQMVGWIQSLETQRTGIDHKDELCNDVIKSRFVPGSQFMEWSKAELSSDYRYSFRSENPGHKLTTFEAWNNTIKEKDYQGFTSEGHRLLINKKELLMFLKSQNKCMILSCEIGRTVKKYEDRSFNDRYDNRYTLLYLIFPDGTIKTIAGDYNLR